MAHKDADLRKIKELIKIMKTNELVEVEIKHGDDKIFLKRSQPQQVVNHVPMMRLDAGTVPVGSQTAEASSQSSASQPVPGDENLKEIISPIVGTYYAKPSPDSEPYVEVGTVVNTQTVVCIIEAMKVLNEIKAETSGTIVEVLVSNGQAVEYGQPLFKIEPD